MTSSIRYGMVLFAALLAGCASAEQPKAESAQTESTAAAPATCPCGGDCATCACGRGPCAGLRDGLGPRARGPRARGPRGGRGMGPGACGMAMGPGAGMGVGPGGVGPGLAVCNIGGPRLDAAAEQAVVRALEDEWHAEATYQAAQPQLMSLRLGNIVRMEQRHAAVLVHVLEAHGNAVPAKPSLTLTKPGDSKAVCEAGVEAEKKNIALYDELLKASLPTDVACVFSHLQQVSRQRHLPAFERCSG